MAQEKQDVRDLSLADLLDQPVEVATRNARKARAAPGVVWVLTREEILATGARDLMEVLQLVPGFSFHSDVEGVVGVGFRGLWGHEGKVLVLVDGIEQNELLYSTTQFGHHVLPHNIERVEVIRGPGSAIYGGTAELAVINVITRSGAELMGGEVAGRYAQTARGYSDFSGGLALGWASEEHKLDVSANIAIGQGRRTTRHYLDFDQGDVDLRGSSRLDPLTLSVGVKWHGLKARFFYDDYTVGAQIGYGQALESASEAVRFRTIGVDAQYDFQFSDHLVLRPHVSYRENTPWQSTDHASALFYDKTASRLLGGLALEYNPTADFSLTLGAEVFQDHAWLNDSAVIASQTTFAGAQQVTYSNTAIYAQALWDTEWVNIAVGGRFEQHSTVGGNFAPRIALTRQLDRFNFKLLYSGAFRSPGIEDLNLSEHLQAEHVDVGEAEVGVTVLDFLYASVNGFYTRISQPIAYLYDEATATESYQNAAPVSTAGVEAQLVARGKRGFGTLSYSLAVPDETSVYEVHPQVLPSAESHRTLGFAIHKVTATGKLRIWRGLSAGGSLVVQSDRYGFVRDPAFANDPTPGHPGVLTLLPATALIGLWVGYEDLGLRGLSIQAGVGNLLDENVPFVQPYDSGSAPTPGRGREVFVRLSYALHVDS